MWNLTLLILIVAIGFMVGSWYGRRTGLMFILTFLVLIAVVYYDLRDCYLDLDGRLNPFVCGSTISTNLF